jgi:uncharacterized protein (TIGR03435 family)
MDIQRLVAATGLAGISLTSGVLAQQPASPRPTFEVATIKRTVSVSDGSFVRVQPGGRLSVGNNSLWNIIRNAYRVQGFQIVGGPDWINSERWEIVAKAEGDPPPDQLMAMLQNLLADRFKLVIRREMRDSPIYALVMARPDGRLGPQLHASSTDCAALIAAARASGNTRLPAPPGGGPLCGTRQNRGIMETNATTMADLARNLSTVAGRSIVDKTGLTGNFDLKLTWTAETPARAPGAAAGGPTAEDTVSLFTAIQEQLGLKLDPQHGHVDTLVIDSAERPVED